VLDEEVTPIPLLWEKSLMKRENVAGSTHSDAIRKTLYGLLQVNRTKTH
jgi:hypothetical protein